MDKAQRTNYLLKNTVIFALGSIGSKFISFLLVPLYTNALTPDQYGFIDVIISVCTILIPLLTFNIGDAVLRFSLDKDANYKKIVSICFVFTIISLLIGLFIFPILIFFEEYSKYKFYIYFYCTSLSLAQLFMFYLRGREKLRDYAIASIIQTFITAISSIIFLVKMSLGIEGYFLSYIVSNIVTFLFAVIRGNIIKTIHNYVWDSQLCKKMIKYSIVLVPTSLMWWIMNSSDHIMITAMIGNDANGIYAVACKIPTIVTSITMIFNQAWGYSAIKEANAADIEDYNNRVYKRLIMLLCLMTGGALLIIKPFLSFYVKDSYYEAWIYVAPLLIGALFMSLGTFLSTSYNVNKDSWGYLISGMTGAVLNLILNFLWIRKNGVMGAALATCLSYFVVFLFRAIHTRKYIIIHVFNLRDILSILLLVSISLSLNINNVLSYLLIVIQLTMICIIYKKEIFSIFNDIFTSIKKKI